MEWPQITAIILFAMSGAINLAKDGEPKGNYSFVEYLFGLAIWLVIFYFGGFWQ